MRKKILQQLFLLYLCSVPFLSEAQDRVFARTYQTNILPKGVKDLESWTTFRFGREMFYSRIDQRLEFEIGVAKRVQSALYLNITHVKFAEVVYDIHKVAETEFSISSEWKTKLSDPVANKLGTGLYAEATIGPDEFELEAKLLLDKVIGKNLIAFNAVGEVEFEAVVELEDGEAKTKIELEKYPVEFDLGYMFMAKKFGVGVELRNHNLITKEDGFRSSAFFGGPTIYYNPGDWFVILNILPQWVNFHKGDGIEGTRDLTAHEKAEIRILLSWTLP